VTLCAFSDEAQAGLNKFSLLDRIDSWTIERKIDSFKGTVTCRASIFSTGSWFDSRIRLDKDGEIVFPPGQQRKKIDTEKTIENVKSSLKLCRSGLIYMPELQQE
tara:strand:- start:1008 stop:1322 length:315 start_codon:yes stop_codon:yes gene_type:complete